LIALFAVGCVFLAAGCTPSDTETTPIDTPETTDTTTDEPTIGEMQTLDNLDAITVTGDFNTLPTVDAPYAFNVAKTMCKTTIEGAGAAIDADDTVFELNYTGINATTGETFDSSIINGTPIMEATISSATFVTGFDTCLRGAKGGSRVVMAITGADGYDSAGGQPDAGINVGDTMLFVVDIIQVEFKGPEGQHLLDGNQWVNVTDTSGVPSVTINQGVPAPTDLVTTVLIQGTGPKVDPGDAVYVNFLWVDFATGAEIQNSYTSGGGPQPDYLADMIPGWRTALAGQPTGSRLLLIVPGDQAYPQGNATPSVSPNATLVFVVDILYTWVPQQQTST